MQSFSLSFLFSCLPMDGDLGFSFFLRYLATFAIWATEKENKDRLEMQEA